MKERIQRLLKVMGADFALITEQCIQESDPHKKQIAWMNMHISGSRIIALLNQVLEHATDKDMSELESELAEWEKRIEADEQRRDQ